MNFGREQQHQKQIKSNNKVSVCLYLLNFSMANRICRYEQHNHSRMSSTSSIYTREYRNQIMPIYRVRLSANTHAHTHTHLQEGLADIL